MSASCSAAVFRIDQLADDSGCELVANFRSLGKRIVGRGTLKEMQNLATEAVRRGGIHGAGDVCFCNSMGGPVITASKGHFILPVPRVGKYALQWHRQCFTGTRWVEDKSEGNLPVVHRAALGQGFLIERRELARNRHRFVFVSPAGRFRVMTLEGSLENVLNRARSAASYLKDDVDFPQGFDTFHVRLRGEVCHLLHCPVPGILGYTVRGDLEIYLWEVGWQDFAIMVVDKNTRCVARGCLAELRGWEVTQKMGLPSTIPRLGQSAGLFPSSWKLEDVLKDLSKIDGLRSRGRRRVVNALNRVPSGPGSITYRKLLWGLLLTFRDGCRKNRRWTGPALHHFLTEPGYLDETPKERAFQGALRLCDKHARTLIERAGRSHVRMVLFEKLAE